MKIQAKNSKIASMKLCVPHDGVIEIDVNGTAEVSTQCAIALVKGTNDWDYVKGSTDEEDSKGGAEGDVDEREEFVSKLNSMKMEELKAMAVEGELPEEEWKKLNSKKLLSAYLLSKYDEAATAQAEDEDEEEVEEEEVKKPAKVEVEEDEEDEEED